MAINKTGGIRQDSAKLLRITLCLAVLCSGSAARAQEPSARERELEDLVRKLSDRVESLEQRLGALDGQSGTSTRPAQTGSGGPADHQPSSSNQPSNTTARLDNLEQAVKEIQEESPPSADSESWKKMKKWVDDPMTFRPYWKDGLNFENADKSFKMKIGGRLLWDVAFFDDRNVDPDFKNDSEIRRARLYISGQVYENIDFKAQYDFAGGDADFKDVYVGVKKVPWVGNLRFGQFKEPFGLEEQSSSNYITFMERSLVQTFVPERNTGVMAFNTMAKDRMTWAVGAFRQTDSFGDGIGGRDYNFTGRLTALPMYRDEGREYLHVGAAYTYQNYDDDRFRYRARPESHLAPRLVDTGVMMVDYGQVLGLELLWVDGPFSAQAEYAHSWLSGASYVIGDPKFWAASAQASYFITGEHRPYKKSAGTFTRLRPKNNFDGKGGPGAWEVAARYSYLTLNDANVDGGRLADISLGLNWYWNPNMRMMWNYIFADPSEGGEASIFQWRVQFAF